MPRYNHVSKKARSRARKRFERSPRYTMARLSVNLLRSVHTIESAFNDLGARAARNVDLIAKAFGVPSEFLNSQDRYRKTVLGEYVPDHRTLSEGESDEQN